MATCVVVPGPQCVDLPFVRAGDRNATDFHLHADGVPIDLTGQTLTAAARLKKQDQGTAPLIAEIDIINAANGDFTLRWPGDDVTTLLLNGAGPVLDRWSGVWDLQADNGVDDPVTLLEGKLKAGWDVAR